MPADRGLGADYARSLVAVYRDAETRLLNLIAAELRQGLDAPDWAVAKMAALKTLRRQAEQVVAQLDRDTSGMVEQVLVLAALKGGRSALEDIARLAVRGAARPPLLGRLVELPARIEHLRNRRDLDAARAVLPGAEALARLQFALVSQLKATHLRILRWTVDIYRTVIARASADVLLGTRTRREAAQQAWQQLTARGVTGYVDQRGRRWSLGSYVEMAVRTTTAQAAVQAHLDRLEADGHDLVVVSNVPGECVKCRPWESKVLSISSHDAGWVTTRHAITGRPTRVHVAGDVAAAVAAGLQHPGCRHSLSLYLPGVTVPPTGTADPAGDAARQQLRTLERQVRAWKTRADIALDPSAQRAAQTKVRLYRGRIRDHVNTTGLLRQRHREQVGAR